MQALSSTVSMGRHLRVAPVQPKQNPGMRRLLPPLPTPAKRHLLAPLPTLAKRCSHPGECCTRAACSRPPAGRADSVCTVCCCPSLESRKPPLCPTGPAAAPIRGIRHHAMPKPGSAPEPNSEVSGLLSWLL